ncbi:MAG: hypothetical protein WDW36_000684 [Sanguina aurantia]
MGALADYLQELRSLPPEIPLEPELKPHRKDLNDKIKEDHELKAGAVMQAILAPGMGEDSPSEGDMVHIHYSVISEEDDTLYSTRSEEGGPGHAFAVTLEKGCRGPRGWEVALKGMHKGGRVLIKVLPGYGYSHPLCKLLPPHPSILPGSALSFDLELVSWCPASEVRLLGADDGTGLMRRVLVEGTGFESPRPPFEVTFTCEMRSPSYDGISLSGLRYFQADHTRPMTLQLGLGLIPEGLEECLGHMAKGERSVFIVPTSLMRHPKPPARDDDEGGGSDSGGEEGREAAAGGDVCDLPPMMVPPAPEKGTQVEVEVHLISLVQVRDMMGTGEIMKRRLREGNGDFPVDCPLHDTSVKIHYRVRPMGPSGQPPGPWVFDSRRDPQPTAVAAPQGPHHDGSANGSSSSSAAPASKGKDPQVGGAGAGGGADSSEPNDGSNGCTSKPHGGVEASDVGGGSSRGAAESHSSSSCAAGSSGVPTAGCGLGQGQGSTLSVSDPGSSDPKSPCDAAATCQDPGPPGVGSSSTPAASTAAPLHGGEAATPPRGLDRAAELEPIEFDTGCGEMPEGLEQTVKLMVPGELASATCTPRYCYQGSGAAAPAGVGSSDRLEFEVELVSFQREGYWQTLEMDERLQLSERIKAKAGELYRRKQYGFARARYDRLLRMLESTRDFETQEEVDAIDKLKTSMAGNIALCYVGLEKWSEAVTWCNKVLEHDPDNPKLLLRRGRALSHFGRFEDSEMDFLKVQRMPEQGKALIMDAERESALNRQRAQAAEKRQKSQFKSFWDRAV